MKFEHYMSECSIVPLQKKETLFFREWMIQLKEAV